MDERPMTENDRPEPRPPEYGAIDAAVSAVREALAYGDARAAVAAVAELPPADTSDVLIELSEEERALLLTSLPLEFAAEVIGEMGREDASEALDAVEPEQLADILDAADPEVAVDVLKDLDPDKAELTLGSMDEAAAVIPLLDYADDTAGGRMSTDYVAVSPGTIASNALDILRLRGDEAEDYRYVYVVDEQGVLTGVLTIRRLALAREQTAVSEVANSEPVRVSTDTDQEECARLVRRYDLPELPVIDGSGRLVGVLDRDSLVDVAAEEDTEDMLRIAAAAGDRLSGSRRRSIRRRMPWLLVNLGTTFLAAAVVGAFESTIAKVVVLAAFLPVIAGQGGIAGTQTLTLVIRAIALDEPSVRHVRRLLWREVVLGVVHGVVLAVFVALAAIAWQRNATLGLVLALAMVGNMIVAAVVGGGVPLLLRRMRMDPAVSSAVVVTTATDVLGFLLFLGLATAFLSLLM